MQASKQVVYLIGKFTFLSSGFFLSAWRVNFSFLDLSTSAWGHTCIWLLFFLASSLCFTSLGVCMASVCLARVCLFSIMVCLNCYFERCGDCRFGFHDLYEVVNSCARECIFVRYVSTVPWSKCNEVGTSCLQEPMDGYIACDNTSWAIEKMAHSYDIGVVRVLWG
jgi:hypothetical protein